MADASRPGDNLYTSSLVALDLRTGKLVWYYQQVPHDRWGYDVASSPVLLDVERRRPVGCPAVAHASKTGWVFVHDRRDGQLLFKSEAFVPQRNLFTPPQPGDGVRDRAGHRAAGPTGRPPPTTPDGRLFFVGALHLPTRYIAHRSDATPTARRCSTPARRTPTKLGHADRARPRARRHGCAGR